MCSGNKTRFGTTRTVIVDVRNMTHTLVSSFFARRSTVCTENAILLQKQIVAIYCHHGSAIKYQMPLHCQIHRAFEV